jgi:Tfp pilus assembly protein PilE
VAFGRGFRRVEVMIRLALLAVLAALPAHAQQAQCGPRADVAAHLTGKFGETRRGMGIAANNTVMEVWASEATGTWTITVTMPDGATCLVASGQGFEALAESLPPKGDPA